MIIVSFSYALIRPHYIEKYLKQSLEQVVIEFETVKKIILLILPITIGFGALGFYIAHIQFSFIKIPILGHNLLLLYETILNFASGFISVGIASLLMYGLTISKKEFRFYFARVCFKSAVSKKDIFKQMHYFSLGLLEYNRYLKRHLKHQIKDIDKIFSKVSLLDNDAKTEAIRSFSDSFETETDKLNPLRYASSGLMLIKSEDIESFLVPESLKSRLKVVGTFLGASIPIVISIITLYVTLTAPHKPGT